MPGPVGAWVAREGIHDPQLRLSAPASSRASRAPTGFAFNTVISLPRQRSFVGAWLAREGIHDPPLRLSVPASSRASRAPTGFAFNTVISLPRQRSFVGAWLAREGIHDPQLRLSAPASSRASRAPTGFAFNTVISLSRQRSFVGAWLAREEVGTFIDFSAPEMLPSRASRNAVRSLQRDFCQTAERCSYRIIEPTMISTTPPTISAR